MSVFDDAQYTIGEQGPPGAATVEQVGDLETRLAARELITIPTVTTDLTNWSTTTPTEGQLAIYTGGKWTPTTRPTITITGNLTIATDNGASNITAGVKADIPLDFIGRIIGWKLLNTPSGNITWQVWKDSYSNYPPTSADLILTASTSGAEKANAAGLNIAVAAGDTFRFYVPSTATVTRSTISLIITREV